MSNRIQRDRILEQLGGEDGKVNNYHTFIVKNMEKRQEKQYWVPVPGTVMPMFLCGSHDWRYLGPSNSKAVSEKLAELDKAQAHIVGEQKTEETDDYVVSLEISDLGIGLPAIPDALNTPIDELVPGVQKGKTEQENEP